MPALKGMRLVTVSESGEDVPLDEAVIKDVTGNEAITARFLYREFFHCVPEFKITLSTNRKRTVYGQDYAIWRRLCLAPFEVTISEGEREGEIHKRLLRDETAGILNWALTGLREQQKAGLRPPTKIQAATEGLAGLERLPENGRQLPLRVLNEFLKIMRNGNRLACGDTPFTFASNSTP